MRRFAEDFPTLHDARARPRRERGLGGCNGALRIVGTGPRVDANNVIGIGRVDIVGGFAVHPFAVNQVLVHLGHRSVLMTIVFRGPVARPVVQVFVSRCLAAL